jgi:4-amino-4-deoxy-L-arabinose transferase-like glycosyltransferase
MSAASDTAAETTSEAGTFVAAADRERPTAEAMAAEQRGEPRRPWLLLLAMAVTAASLFGPLSASGIWDPHELRVADLSRRIALVLLGAKGLAVEGALNSVPTLGELARGQLPFTSVAVGFRAFGLHEWAGRLPLAVWGLVGVLATWALVARLADRAAAAFSALVLATMPLYFLHARTILGDVVTMSAIAMASAGLGLAAFDRPQSGALGAGHLRRVLWLVLGLVGLGAGFGSRGLLVGVAVPAVGVGLAWLITRGGRTGRDRFADFTGVLALLIGVSAVVVGMRALAGVLDRPTEFSMLVGSAINKERVMPTFDLVIHHLGHGLFPWSALIPLAVGRLLISPKGADPIEIERQGALRALVLLVSVAGFAVYGAMAPVTGHIPFGPVFALAAIAGIGLRDFERGAPGSRAVAMAVVAFLILFYYDFKNFPEKGLSAFGVGEARFPESFKEDATRYIKYGTVLASGVFFLSFMERQSDATRRFDREEYLAWPRTLRGLWSGNLWFGVLVLEAAFVGFTLLTWLSDRYFHWQKFEVMGELGRTVSTWGYVALPAALVMPSVLLFIRDLVRSFYAPGFGVGGGARRRLEHSLPRVARFQPSRAVGSALALTAFAATLSLGYYPALAAQISPKEVFESYRKLARQGEDLGMMGVGAGSASYYAGRDVPTFSNTASGFGWLMEANSRRWLVIRSNDLAQMNSMYRGRVTPAQNLPVLDARSSEILLISNRLEDGETNENPFRDWVLTERPAPSRALDANFGNQLDAIGWDVTTLDGKVVDSVVPRKRYKFVIYYKVLSSISGTWETFVHIDGFQRRFNGDHKTLDGKYAFHLWRVGDYMADVYEFSLEPNFTPGEYRVYYGLFMGDRRLEVKRGRHHEDRLEAGFLRVR